jgi:hypothetical protein
MNEDRDWNQLGNAWKAEAAAFSAASSGLGSTKAHFRLAAMQRWMIYLAAFSGIAFVTSLCFMRQSASNYTFTVIAWSAFFSFGSFWVSQHDPAGELARETTAALASRSRRLHRSAQLLDFGRVLIGVETLISLGFWIALHRGDSRPLWGGAVPIAFIGLLLYGSLSVVLKRTRRELGRLGSIVAALARTE